MYSIIKFRDYCFSSNLILVSGIYDYLIEVHGIDNIKYDFNDILFYVKKWQMLCKYPNNQNLNEQ